MSVCNYIGEVVVCALQRSYALRTLIVSTSKWICVCVVCPSAKGLLCRRDTRSDDGQGWDPPSKAVSVFFKGPVDVVIDDSSPSEGSEASAFTRVGNYIAVNAKDFLGRVARTHVGHHAKHEIGKVWPRSTAHRTHRLPVSRRKGATKTETHFDRSDLASQEFDVL